MDTSYGDKFKGDGLSVDLFPFFREKLSIVTVESP